MIEQAVRDERIPDKEEEPQTSKRTQGQRDRDRVLYCSAFRRLANVTQVVSADHGYLVHNRLTHTLKVAQIARRLAEYFLKEQSKLAEDLGGLNADVVEAAALAHDIGHPPFGHLAEKVLDELAVAAGGYEGNAQSFRIVTKLAIRIEDRRGLNLTRATLNALLKYPWLRKTDDEKKNRKWGAYHSEEDIFNDVRKPFKDDERKTLEAEIMDYADDIAYSVYDLEDFYKAGKIPLERFARRKEEEDAKLKDEFIKASFDRWKREKKPAVGTEPECRNAFDAVSEFFPPWPFSGRAVERGFLRDMTSIFVGEFVKGIRLRNPPDEAKPRVEIDDALRRQMKMLQELTWQYVIENPALATQQHGYELVIRHLFKWLLTAVEKGKWALFPPGIRELITAADRSPQNVRLVVDFIASMSEPQALELHQRLSGVSTGSFFKNVGY